MQQLGIEASLDKARARIEALTQLANATCSWTRDQDLTKKQTGMAKALDAWRESLDEIKDFMQCLIEFEVQEAEISELTKRTKRTVMEKATFYLFY